MQIHILTIMKVESPSKIILATKHYRKHYILDILYICIMSIRRLMSVTMSLGVEGSTDVRTNNFDLT